MLASNEMKKNTEHQSNSYASGEKKNFFFGSQLSCEILKLGIPFLLLEKSSVSGITMSATVLKYVLHYCN